MKKTFEKIKELIVFYAELAVKFSKHKISAVLLFSGFVLLILAEAYRKPGYTPYILIQFFGWLFLVFIYIMEIILKENCKQHLGRVLATSIAWFVSAIIFIEYDKKDLFLFIYKLYTAWEYILIGCILYDFMTLLSDKTSENERLMKEKEENEKNEVKESKKIDNKKKHKKRKNKKH